MEQTSSTGAEIRVGRFWLRLALFLAPVMGLIAAAEYAMWRSGEARPVTKAVESQRAESAIFLREYMPQDEALYKRLLMAERHPKVLVLGSSRTMQLSAPMVGESGTEFLNAGGLINTIGDLEQVLSGTAAERHPPVILLGVDFWWFNDEWPGEARVLGADAAFNWRAHVSAARRVTIRPVLLWSLIGAPAAGDTGRIGISALADRFRIPAGWESATDPCTAGNGRAVDFCGSRITASD